MLRGAWHGSAIFVSVLLLVPTLCLAQADRGAITGMVIDASGGAVPDVEVTITHIGTNIERTTRTGATGNYVLSRLPIGQYTLSATKEGFRTHQQTGIPVRVDQTVRIDITLDLGQVTETVTVTGQVPLIQSESAEIGLTVNSEQFLELPLTLGGGIRNPAKFISLQPGVMPGSTWEKHIGGGSRFQDQTYYDGIALSRGDLSNDGEVNPSVDAIAEFKLISNNYSAEFAHATAGITTFTIKSGTNELHGNGFWFNSIEKFNARSFFQAERPTYKQNEWGGTIGGPILLPKVYDGRNKSFFFFSFDQFYRRSPGASQVATVPTSRMLQGDFGEWAAAGQGSIYDPASGRLDATGKYVRDPFLNNIIPKSRWSTVSSNLVGYHPPPDNPGLANNFNLYPGFPKADSGTGGFKIDHYLSDAHRLSSMFNYTDRPQVKSQPSRNAGNNSLVPYGADNPLDGHDVQRFTTRIVRLNYDWIVSPTVLNHFGGGLSRCRNPMISAGFGKGWPEKLGLKGVGGDLAPWVDFNHDYVRFGDYDVYDWYYTNFTFLDTLSITRGNHNLKIGFELQSQRNNRYTYRQSGGNFQFNQLSTGLPGVAKSGNSFASFLIGDVMSGLALFPGLQAGDRSRYYSPWINDDWKVTSRLTLNLGLRWEIQPPFTDPNNRFSWLDPTKPNAAIGNFPGAYAFAGREGNTSLGKTHWRDIAPRLGFAYRIMESTVVRGGYGLFFAQVTGPAVSTEGFNVTASFSSPDNGITPGFNWDDGFPQNFIKPPTIDPALKNGQSARLVDPERLALIPYSQQYNLLIEQQIGQSTSVSAGYVANLGRRLEHSWGLNQVHPSYLSLGNLLTRHILDPAVVAAGFNEPFAGFVDLWGTSGTLAQALRRFPQFTGVSQARANFGRSNYHSFQLYAERRMSRGLGFTVAYTASKYISDGRSGTRRDDFNRALDRSLDYADQPQILTFSYVYELPFGRGKNFVNTGPLVKVLGGWKITGIHSYYTETPISVSTTNTLPLFNPGQTPNLTGASPVGPKGSGKFDPGRGDLWLNPAAFQNPAPFTFGDAPRFLNNIRPPYGRSESIGILKDTVWMERYRLQFRMEMTNPFNRVVFRSPTSNFASGSFGKIGRVRGGRNIQFALKMYF